MKFGRFLEKQAKALLEKAIDPSNEDTPSPELEWLAGLTNTSPNVLSTRLRSLSDLYDQEVRQPRIREKEQKANSHSEPIPKLDEQANATTSTSGDHQAEILKYTSIALDFEKNIKSHKKITRHLVSACEAYTQQGEIDARPDSDILSWMKNLSEGLLKRAEWDTFDTLVNYGVIRKELGLLFSSIPASLKSKITRRSMELDQTELDGLHHMVQRMLNSNEDRSRLYELRGEAAQSILELLDTLRIRLVDRNDSRTRRRIEQISLKICGLAGQIPSSYILSTGLSRSDETPFVAGGFADVYRGKYNETNVALKVVRVAGKKNIRKAHKAFYKEALMWKWLSHPNIVPFLGIADQDMFPLCLVSIWMENGNLLEYIRRHPMANPLKLACDTANGLAYIHSLRLVHGDIKSPNILVDQEHKACLSDFGLARVAQDTQAKGITVTSTNTQYGSIRWMAPELLHADHVSPNESSFKTASPSDIYAFGMVLLEIFTGKFPFHEHKREGPIVLAIIAGRRPSRPKQTKLPGLDDNVWKLIEDCWKADPTQRPEMSTVLPIVEEFLRTSPQPSDYPGNPQASEVTEESTDEEVLEHSDSDSDSDSD